jgi:hypothetical protein
VPEPTPQRLKCSRKDWFGSRLNGLSSKTSIDGNCFVRSMLAHRDLAPSRQLLPSDAMDKTRITAERVRIQRTREQQELVDHICKTRLALVRVAGLRAVDKLDEDLALSCPE